MNSESKMNCGFKIDLIVWKLSDIDCNNENAKSLK